MNTTSEETSDEWMQFDQQTVNELSGPSLGFSDATIVATSVSPDSNLSPSGSHSPSDQRKGSNSTSSSKPIRRRFRASKRTPVTLLSANTGNFRALVQQFTGCPSKSHTLGSRRGPINLNFAAGNDQRNQTGIVTSGNGCHCYQQSYPDNSSHHHQHQHYYQVQQHAVPFDNINHDAFFATTSSRANADDEILGGFDDLDNISLQDVVYSNENANDSNYFL